jgi:hypothetical protein
MLQLTVWLPADIPVSVTGVLEPVLFPSRLTVAPVGVELMETDPVTGAWRVRVSLTVEVRPEFTVTVWDASVYPVMLQRTV